MAESSEDAARRLAEETLDKLDSECGVVLDADERAEWLPYLLAYGRARERAALEKAAEVALAQANKWANDPHRSDSRMQACLSVEAAIRSLLEE